KEKEPSGMIASGGVCSTAAEKRTTPLFLSTAIFPGFFWWRAVLEAFGCSLQEDLRGQGPGPVAA
ncbi:MAG: hypothetical protein ACPGAP_02740, partial [Akkermansiaceae bacterium]